jgi:spore germination cell wall hydrolase CwlJ-like protein
MKLLSLHVIAFFMLPVFSWAQDTQCSRYTTEDQCMTCACYYESKSEIFEGQVAVAQTILTRKAHKLYPKTACAVVYQKDQFTWAKNAKPMTNKAQINSCVAAVKEAKERGPNGYISFNNGPKPGGAEISYCEKIGNHKFYARTSQGCPSRSTASSKARPKTSKKSSAK